MNEEHRGAEGERMSMVGELIFEPMGGRAQYVYDLLLEERRQEEKDKDQADRLQGRCDSCGAWACDLPEKQLTLVAGEALCDDCGGRLE